MRVARFALASAFCLSLSLSLFAQQESLGDLARRVRAERAAKQAANAAADASPADGDAAKPSTAQQPSKQKTPGDPAAADLSQESYVIEHSWTKVAVEADGTAVREEDSAVRISADGGIKRFAVLRFSFTSANEVVDVVSVQVRKPDGTIIKTPESNIQEMSQEVTRSAPMYSDIREKHVAVRGLGIGDLLEFKVRTRTVKPQLPGQFWFEYSFLKGAMIKDERLEVSYPSDRYFNIRSTEIKPEISDTADARRVYSWSRSNLVEKSDSDTTPTTTEGRRSVPSVQVSTFQSWEEVGRWYGILQSEQIKPTPVIEAKAAELTKGLSGDEEKIQAIYNFVSLNIHYVGLSFGIGRYQPHSAEDVLANEYGDCKDKHTLLASLLKSAGYDSWPVLINSSRDIDPELPSVGQFDHVIDAIPLGGKLLWADSTAEVAPFGLLMPTLRGKQALSIPTNGIPKLLRTPEEPPFASSQTFSVNGKLDRAGTLSAHMELTARGDMEVVLRSALRQLSQSQWKQFAQAFSYGLGYAGDVSDVQISDIGNLDKPLHLTYEYTRKKYGSWDTLQITPPLPSFGFEAKYSSIEKAPSKAEELGAPSELIYRSKLELPPDYTFAAPRAVHIIRPYIEYHAVHSIKDNVLISTRRIVIRQHTVPRNDWQSFRLFCKEVSEDEGKYIKLQLLNTALRESEQVSASSAAR